MKKRLTEAGSEGSHEMWFGSNQISKDLRSQYMGTTPGRTTFNGAHYNHTHQIVDQHQADILFFKRKVCLNHYSTSIPKKSTHFYISLKIEYL